MPGIVCLGDATTHGGKVITAEFDLEDLKWVILMVLFNIPGCENAYQQMEELLFEVNEGMLH